MGSSALLAPSDLGERKLTGLGGDQQQAEVSPVAEKVVEVPIHLHGKKGVLSLTKGMLRHATPVTDLSPESTNRICSALEA